MATKDIKTYTVQQVSDMIGISRQESMRLIKKSRFPFPVIQVGSNWVVPRKAVDRSLLNGDNWNLTEATKVRRGKKPKWAKGEYVNWNFRIHKDLAEAFNFVVDRMNEKLASPLSYTDARLLAFQEFIERRPVEE